MLRPLGLCLFFVLGCKANDAATSNAPDAALQNDASIDGTTVVVRACEVPGETRACYEGRGGSQDVGACRAGEQTCGDDHTWGACLGQTLPARDVCGNSLDEDCDGTADEDTDIDGDGFSTCDGDCCDSEFDCATPTLVNPGAIDVASNALDDDCDGMTDNAASACDDGLT